MRKCQKREINPNLNTQEFFLNKIIKSSLPLQIRSINTFKAEIKKLLMKKCLFSLFSDIWFTIPSFPFAHLPQKKIRIRNNWMQYFELIAVLPENTGTSPTPIGRYTSKTNAKTRLPTNSVAISSILQLAVYLPSLYSQQYPKFTNHKFYNLNR